MAGKMLCRHCGTDGVPATAPLAVCSACANSPLCDRCGHPRGDHAEVFVRGGDPACRRLLGDFQTLTSWLCPCSGFRPVAGPLRDAAFAEADDGPAPLRLA
jgi:hypothetical protein